MNATTVISIFKWCPEEAPALESRATFVKMKVPLKHRINEEEFSYLGSSGHGLIHILTKCQINLKLKEQVKIRNYTSDVFI